MHYEQYIVNSIEFNSNIKKVCLKNDNVLLKFYTNIYCNPQKEKKNKYFKEGKNSTDIQLTTHKITT